MWLIRFAFMDVMRAVHQQTTRSLSTGKRAVATPYKAEAFRGGKRRTQA